MELLKYPNTIALFFFVPLFIYFAWRTFNIKYKYEKLFDFTILYLFFGFLTERVLFVVTNWNSISITGWSLVNFTNTLPFLLLNFDIYEGFSLIYFMMGAIFGISVYNWINTIHKVGYDTLDRITRLTIICLFMILLVGIASQFVRSDFNVSQLEISTLIPYLVRLLEFVFLLAIYYFLNSFWNKKNGLYTSIAILLITIGEFVIDYLDPAYMPTFLGILNTQQAIGVISIILSINLLLTSIATLQEQEIRKKLTHIKPTMNKGFAISFANRRRVTNPINIRFKNFSTNKRRYSDSANRP